MAGGLRSSSKPSIRALCLWKQPAAAPIRALAGARVGHHPSGDAAVLFRRQYGAGAATVVAVSHRRRRRHHVRLRRRAGVPTRIQRAGPLLGRPNGAGRGGVGPEAAHLGDAPVVRRGAQAGVRPGGVLAAGGGAVAARGRRCRGPRIHHRG
eukprot:ctg_2165.g429